MLFSTECAGRGADLHGEGAERFLGTPVSTTPLSSVEPWRRTSLVIGSDAGGSRKCIVTASARSAGTASDRHWAMLSLNGCSEIQFKCLFTQWA